MNKLWLAFKLLLLHRQNQYLRRDKKKRRLWLAFKLLLLHRQNQLLPLVCAIFFRCDLLSNYYFCIGKTSCFCCSFCFKQLWLAFKLLLLHRQNQSAERFVPVLRSCDLLSNYYFCIGKTSVLKWIINPVFVVTCFQIITFA